MNAKRNRKFLVLIPLILISIAVLLRKDTYIHKECPTNNIITVKEGGRLGNCVWEYIAVLGLQNPLRLTPYIPKGLLHCLGKVFKNLSIPAYEESLLSDKCRTLHEGYYPKCQSKILPWGSRPWDHLCHTLRHGNSIPPEVALKPINTLMKLKDSGKLPSILILPKWIANDHAFAQIGIHKFKEEMLFRDDIKTLAAKTLNGIRKKVGNGNVTFVGVHVRRRDYLRYLAQKLGNKVAIADIDYYKRAINKMRDLYSDTKLVFIVVSDDYFWCMKKLVNEKNGIFWGGLEHSIFIKSSAEMKEMSAAHDLAVLSMQNHTIIGYGTYAVTGSLLSGGHMIFRNISRNGQPYDFLTLRLCRILPNCELM